MKTLNIDSSVAQRLAQIALFERLQSYLELYPKKWAHGISKIAKSQNKNPIEFAEGMRKCFKVLLRSQLKAAIREFEGFARSVGSVDLLADCDPFYSIICEELHWSARRFYRDIVSKAKAEQLDPVECLNYLLDQSPAMIDWTIDKAVEILKRNK
jgi:hypothetical protein